MRHSYSSIKKYLECPAAYRYSYMLRLPDPPNAAMMRGTRLHSLCEEYMLADPSVPVPFDIRKIGLTLYRLREHHAKPEEVWMVDEEWRPTKDEAKARLKAIIDVHWMDKSVLRLHDYKSGREYPSHADQLELYAAIGLCVYPDAERVESSAIYIDSGTEGAQRSIIRDMLPYLMGRWGGYVERMDADTEFRPSPGVGCERCSYSSKNGGPCEAWGGNV